MKTVEERLDILERIVRKQSGRTTRTTLGLIPWLPISGHVERPAEDGECFAFMFPMAGMIKRVLIAVDDLGEKNSAEFEIRISKADKTITDKITVKAKEMTGNVSYKIEEGMRAQVFTKDNVQSIWVAFLLDPDRKYFTAVGGVEDTVRIEAAAKECADARLP
jgi:hypothetical protein